MIPLSPLFYPLQKPFLGPKSPSRPSQKGAKKFQYLTNCQQPIAKLPCNFSPFSNLKGGVRVAEGGLKLVES
jgi:hypothetical protein